AEHRRGPTQRREDERHRPLGASPVVDPDDHRLADRSNGGTPPAPLPSVLRRRRSRPEPPRVPSLSAMLLTITTTAPPATDLGFVLHKNPANVRSVNLAFGTAHVFYPEATEERCTAALLLRIDPVGLVRKGRRRGAFALADHVNDRPYVA